MVVCACNPRRVKTEASTGSLTSQPSLFGELQASERHCQGGQFQRNGTQGLTSGLHTHAHTPLLNSKKREGVTAGDSLTVF